MTLTSVSRPAAFVTAATQHGTMIINRFDVHDEPEDTLNPAFGIGHDLLTKGVSSTDEINYGTALLSVLREQRGDGVIAVDCGANIGTFAISWAVHMTGWGSVLAFEPQRMLYYALCGNTVLNNCANLQAEHAAVGSEVGMIHVPMLDYFTPSSFGSLELRCSYRNQPIGQKVDYRKSYKVMLMSLDSLQLPRLDLLKIDVEGMEIEVLDGAKEMIQRHRPVMLIEWVKCKLDGLVPRLAALDYVFLNFAPMAIIALHKDDPILPHIQIDQP